MPGTLIRQAGVVGAGGAGFPTHVKAAASAEIVIANGAECEPLLYKDKELQKRFADLVVSGLELMMTATGAKSGVVGVKEKYHEVMAAYVKALSGKPHLRLLGLGNYYPAGDEYSLVYEATGRLIPQGGIPIQIGAVVDNAETLINVALASKQSVTHTYLTVAGAVKRPVTLKLPVGTPIAEAIRLAGGATVPEFGVLDGGAMMGRPADPAEPLTKTSGGLIILPESHGLWRKKTASQRSIDLIGKSTCDQCSLCTEFCPRYLLGYAIQPHKVMRSLSFSGPDRKVWDEWSLLCCECSLCNLFACPEELDPRDVCVASKRALAEKSVNWRSATLNTGAAPKVHPVREFRKIPLESLMRRIGLWNYRAEAPLDDRVHRVGRVRIPLKQHLGVPAQAVVSPGVKVKAGDLIGEIPEGKLGARVHASIDGTVRSVDTHVVIEA
ncbi:MAG: SLBB domain-containing protein [Elusimicrobia bacterium]|nr:SLBB domain-containing protein [Elusimicrobiota bacterium]